MVERVNRIPIAFTFFLIIMLIFSGLAIALDGNNPVPLADSDGDGLPDWYEIEYGLDLLSDDSGIDEGG